MSVYKLIGKISGGLKNSKELSVDWEIQDFFSLTSSHFESPFFYFNDEYWWLRMTTYAQTSGEVNFHLCRMLPGRKKTIELTFCLNLFPVVMQKMKKHEFTNDSLICSLNNFCTRSDLWKNRRSTNNTVIIYVSMEIDTSPSTRVLSYYNVSSQTDSEITGNVAASDISQSFDKRDKGIQASLEVLPDFEALSTDISYLLDQEMLTDFALNCGDRTFQVHRSILAARSEVFRAMLKNRCRESESGSVEISDLDAPVLESLLKILYSGKVGRLSEGTAVSLYEAADKYAVHCLRRTCSHFMISNMTESNCILYLYTADSRSDPDLKAAAISFILSQPGVFKTTAWLAFLKEHPVLASEVLQTYVTTSNP